jgi:bacterioferritin-associated ferredoxin
VSQGDEEPMYVCLCNALTEAQAKWAVADGARRPREVYAACGCGAQCGRCTRTILGIIREAAGEAAGRVTGGHGG